MRKIQELDRIVLTTDILDHDLKAGETIAVVSVFPDQIRPIRHREIAHARAI
jgi:hypothetical protein